MPAIPLARLGPLRVEAHWSWSIALALVTLSLGMGRLPLLYPEWGPALWWAGGALGAFLFFASIVVHELAHVGVAWTRGLTVQRVTLFVFGGVAFADAEPRSPGDEFAIAGAGPLASAGLAAGCAALALLGHVATGPSAASGPAGAVRVAGAVLGQVALVNLTLAAFNLLPAFPLDGGRLVRAAAWRISGDATRATCWAAAGGRLLATALLLWGLYELVNGRLLPGAWFAALGLFLDRAAIGAGRRVPDAGSAAGSGSSVRPDAAAPR